MNMTVSVVIRTYHRPRHLSTCLDCLSAQSVPPLEIIVVDNGSETASIDLIREREKEFADSGIDLRYVRNQPNSVTTARNLGSGLSNGEIVLFLDDDVILDANYIREIVRVYETNPTAFGVQGYIVISEKQGLLPLFGRSLYRLFLWCYRERDGCRVLPSVHGTYPSKLDKVIPCQWLSGLNQSYRRQVLQEVRYDERLVRSAYGEDLDHSYRVFKRYPGSLFITPWARIVHKRSQQGKPPRKELVYMSQAYSLYLFFKLFDATPVNLCIYLWSTLCWPAIALARAVVRREGDSLIEVRDILGAWYLCLRHIRNLQRGDLDFFNSTWLQQGRRNDCKET